jgi:hypothetical protein
MVFVPTGRFKDKEQKCFELETENMFDRYSWKIRGGGGGRHDTQHNDTQHYDTQHNDQNDIQRNNKKNTTLKIMASSIITLNAYAKCHYADCLLCKV